MSSVLQHLAFILHFSKCDGLGDGVADSALEQRSGDALVGLVLADA
jgi:hypothetical protein